MENCKLRYFNSFEFFDHTGITISGVRAVPTSADIMIKLAARARGPSSRGFDVASLFRHQPHCRALYQTPVAA